MKMAMALDGIKVVDMTQWYQGPVVTAHLADMGAEVIKIENPRGGDPGRGVMATASIPTSGWNSYFQTNNRGKRSVSVDSSTDKGREIVHKLIKDADVFVCNMLRPTIKKLQMDYETLSKINPRLIYLFVSTFGRYGEGKDKPGYDPQGQGRVGVMLALGEPGQNPVYTGSATGDAMGALIGAYAVMVALYHREVTGEGQEVDTSLLGSFIPAAADLLLPYLGTRDHDLTKQHSRKERPNALWNVYRAKDDKWICMCIEDSSEMWARFCKGAGLEKVKKDAMFADPQKRRENSKSLIAALDDVLATRTRDEWLAGWKGLPVGPVNNFADLAADPQPWANDYIIEVDDPKFGRQWQRGICVQLSKTPGKIRDLGPELGQHTEEILVDRLGYSWEDIAKLKDEKVIL
ncbi:MAG: CoA transferase [Dehalococcoidia bacterium]